MSDEIEKTPDEFPVPDAPNVEPPVPVTEVAKKMLYYKSCLASVEARHAEYLQSLERETQFLKSRIDNCKRYLEMCAPSAPGSSIVTDDVAVWFKETKSVDVFDAELVPLEFCRVKTEPDKTLIKEALQAGKEVAGARIVINRHLQVEHGGERARANAQARARRATAKEIS